MKVLNRQYMGYRVITPKNDGCGFPWKLFRPKSPRFPDFFSEWDVSTIQRPDRKGSGFLGLQQV